MPDGFPELKESDDPDQRLFYYDIEPWLLKVKDA